MAVYTKIHQELLIFFLKNYDLGTLISFEGIQEGVENSNYKINMSSGTYILTIFEKRVNENELPFFIELQNHLYKKNIKCPRPIGDRNGRYINIIRNKPSVIMSFLSGQKIDKITARHCYQVGELLATIHQNTTDFTLTRENNLHQKYWRDIFNKCQNIQNNSYNELFETIEKELEYLEKNWPNNLPKGIIHADVFHDNVFFVEDKLSGLIDFYFACNDFYAYEVAICINEWCFDKTGTKYYQFNLDGILGGYQIMRKLTPKEFNNFSILLRGAAMRILLTRLHDQLFHTKEALVIPKDPIVYFRILEFHQQNGPIVATLKK